MVSGKSYKIFDLEKFRPESFSIHISKGRLPEIALHRGSLDSKIEIGIENMKTYKFRKYFQHGKAKRLVPNL